MKTAIKLWEKMGNSYETQITSISKWIESFHVFVAIYAEKHPKEVRNLMASGQIVQEISQKQLGTKQSLITLKHRKKKMTAVIIKLLRYVCNFVVFNMVRGGLY